MLTDKLMSNNHPLAIKNTLSYGSLRKDKKQRISQAPKPCSRAKESSPGHPKTKVFEQVLFFRGFEELD